MKRIALVLCIALLSLSVFAQSGPAGKSVALTFIETSDIHGAIYPYDFVNAKPMATSLAQVASLIAEERAANPNLVLLDDGDSLQGTPAVYYYNFEKTSVPHIWSQALNYLK
ncbi:MAG: bifunctional metallophosphatase/5'-nucleotidase, partial [Spirochaetales bacterium]